MTDSKAPAPNGSDGEYADEKGHSAVDATAVLGDEARAIDPQVAKEVLWKIDMFLIPAMLIGYGLVYYDKAILGSTAILGMTTDLNLSVTHGTQTDTSRLSWATSIFYFGQLIESYPMTYILQRLNPRYVLGPTVTIWAIICAATAGVSTWQGLIVQRFFLGFTESIIPTTFMVTVSSYYTQLEQASRQTWWFGPTGWFNLIGGSVNYGFGHITGGALDRWQYIYILAGGVTFLFGLWCFVLPYSPVEPWFLSPEERIVAVERLRCGQTGLRNHEIKLYQIKEAIFDPIVWLVSLMMASAYTVNGGVTGFGPLIVKTFGYSSLEAPLFTFPLASICAVGIPLSVWLCSKFKNIRIPLIILFCFPVMAGYIMVWKSSWGHRPVTPVAGYSIIGFFGPVVGLIVATGSANVAGETKKSFMASAVFVAYCVGNIVGPQMVRSESKAKHYPELWIGLLAW